jgi:hypothetical protein
MTGRSSVRLADLRGFGNIIRRRDGFAVLIDLDGFATGPRE